MVSAGPGLWLLGRWATGTLGVNPLNALLQGSGQWALWFWALSLAVGPVRQLAVALSRALHAPHGKRLPDWNPLVHLRRQWGLWAFAYASLHLGLYGVLDAGLDAQAVRDDLHDHVYLRLGLLAYGPLLLLAATSHRAAMRWLGVWWRRLHLLSYLAAAVAVGHLWLQAKPGLPAPWLDSAIVAALGGWRVWAWWRGQWTGLTAVPERSPRVRA